MLRSWTPPTRHTPQRLTPTSRGRHYFPENSFNSSITRSYSATKRLSLAFSLSNIVNFRASETSMPPYMVLHRKNVCSVTLCLRQTSRMCAPGDSASRRMRMTCSSVNRFFICKSPITSYHRTHSLFDYMKRTQVSPFLPHGLPHDFAQYFASLVDMLKFKVRRYEKHQTGFTQFARNWQPLGRTPGCTFKGFFLIYLRA